MQLAYHPTHDANTSMSPQQLHQPMANTTPYCLPPDEQGWKNRLQLEYSNRQEKTVIINSKQKGPLTANTLHSPTSGACHTVINQPSQTAHPGDILHLSATLQDKAKVVLTTSGTLTFAASSGAFAHRKQVFNIQKGSTMAWLPQETIHHPNARTKHCTQIRLAEDSHFIGWDIHCFGSPDTNQDFGSGFSSTGLTLLRGNKPVILDRLRISGGKATFNTTVIYEKPVIATFIATDCTREVVEKIKHCHGEELAQSCSLCLKEDTLIIKYSGYDTTEVKRLFTAIWESLESNFF